MAARVVSWTAPDALVLRTPNGETVTLDLPTLLHDHGMLYAITHFEGRALSVHPNTGKFVGVTENRDAGGYVASANGSTATHASAYAAAVARSVNLCEVRKRRKAVVAAASQTPVPVAYFPATPERKPTLPISDFHRAVMTDATVSRTMTCGDAAAAHCAYARYCDAISHMTPVDDAISIRQRYVHDMTKIVTRTTLTRIAEESHSKIEASQSEAHASEDVDECTFVRERTREERDEEGRAKAIRVD